MAKHLKVLVVLRVELLSHGDIFAHFELWGCRKPTGAGDGGDRTGPPWFLPVAKNLEFPGCGNIVTFSQFLFIAVEGFIFEANFGRKSPAIPIRYYLIMVAMFFTVSVVNNYALNLNISMPLHMIFRSGSLIASMALGIIILKKRYSVSKYTSIALVSLGIFTCTFMSAKQVASDSSLNEEDGVQVFLWWLLGIAALTFALLMSARMGIFQETLYQRFGKHSKEALFYNHALPLPGFLLLAPNIYQHAVLFSQSGELGTGILGLDLPILWKTLRESFRPAVRNNGADGIEATNIEVGEEFASGQE
ncbi:UDP-xylose and UDP-N-acetylglucosamine transporter [Manacus vitellinus]|uniref:UDP-xylose and UDP-N-acetylglucosamine transporter n=1 Tax=Manacus vitellinus TaxID=328815 RepID=UPI00115D1776|nr:UDP-xylose and UDP-N-acetylglucosamine transporter [Manacus vitellinus]